MSALSAVALRRVRGVAATSGKSALRSPPVAERPQGVQDSDSFHNFTRNRFVCNEAYEKAQRYVKFDLRELLAIAARATGAASCIKVTKLSEGEYNKALLLIMDNGKEVVAKLPNPNAGRKYYTTASEVATMDFVGTNLAMPVPKVLTRSSRSDDNPVGAEYIILEKAAGIPLETVWSRLDMKDQFKIVETIVEFQRTWAATAFPAHGSLCYASDLDSRMPQIPYCGSESDTATKYVVGPTEGRDWNDDGKVAVEFDRGPWKSALGHLLAAGRRELECVLNMRDLPKSPLQACGPGLYQPTRETKAKAIQRYLDLVPTVSPTESTLNIPCLWHSDLHEGNVFVDPSNPTKITSIIDWQSTEIAPLFMHARKPCVLDHEGPESAGLERPRLPENMAELSIQEQKYARKVLLYQRLCYLYRMLVAKESSKLRKCLEFRETEAFNLIVLAQKLLVEGEVPYLAYLLDLLESGTAISGPESGAAKLPITFSEEEREQIKHDMEVVAEGMEVLHDIKDFLGDLFPAKGMVRHEHYEDAIVALQQVKEQVVAQYAKTEEDKAAWEKSWLFRN